MLRLRATALAHRALSVGAGVAWQRAGCSAVQPPHRYLQLCCVPRSVKGLLGEILYFFWGFTLFAVCCLFFIKGLIKALSFLPVQSLAKSVLAAQCSQ